ncbi:hydroxyisourate hydrolase [Paracoccus sp. IB05]|uniref:hydroxyisourate hydrolase n=1 Tax=Paracoccus sp. IB05 TaxID=2779367 RepID=UPI0018E8FF14|nr:hydroxyisourate hydrolase [Paracoccus sp. IB05]MBJ2151401.1 hydroxyisourate hydrolase [Paracoccus sp. IB05]
MGGRLTTHVLDTARGQPAAGLAISLWRIEGNGRALLARVVTNADGRCDAPLLAGEAMRAGEYELVFAAGDYLRQSGQAQGDGLFLDQIPIRFGIGCADQHYHVPLLLSPFAYSTYRGS